MPARYLLRPDLTSQSALTPLLLLFASNPLRWASLRGGEAFQILCVLISHEGSLEESRLPYFFEVKMVLALPKGRYKFSIKFTVRNVLK